MSGTTSPPSGAQAPLTGAAVFLTIGGIVTWRPHFHVMTGGRGPHGSQSVTYAFNELETRGLGVFFIIVGLFLLATGIHLLRTRTE